MYNAAGSVFDGMRCRSRIGRPLALSALDRCLRLGRVAELHHIAGELSSLSVIRRPTPRRSRPRPHL
ncbi:hypothetical protein [Streptomyces sp. NPDC088196]|uniref:hypothetical protein n=1 Tax=Streptomyces sp. NPDC088196 TaxID=3154868 RepID=UPI00344E173F